VIPIRDKSAAGHEWRIAEIDESRAESIAAASGINPFIARLMVGRGVDDPAQAERFLSPRLSYLYSPFQLEGMHDAVSRLRRALESGERIGIFSDSDLDGLTSLAVLHGLIARINPSIDIIMRYPVADETYGLTRAVVDEMIAAGVRLLVTLDSGIRDVEEIALARAAGIDVIVCDHHHPDDRLPDAIIVNPKRHDCHYPFKDLAGVGVTFKLCCGVLMSYRSGFQKPLLVLCELGDALVALSMTDGAVVSVESLDAQSARIRLPNIVPDDSACIVSLGDRYGWVPSECVPGRRMFDLATLVRDVSDAGTVPAGDGLDALCRALGLERSMSDVPGALAALVSEIDFRKSEKLRNYIETTMPLVALGTIADIMPVIGENRIIVHHGLKNLPATSHPGLAYMVGGLKSLSARNVSWNIVPSLNAPGRFGKTELTAKFFLERENAELGVILKEIGSLNERRRAMVDEIFTSIVRDMSNAETDDTGVLFLVRNDTPDGLTGLVANRLSGHYQKPVIVVSHQGATGLVKGSGRSSVACDFLSIVSSAQGFFEKFGGHEQAFGFTTRAESLPEIEACIREATQSYIGRAPIVRIDCEIPIEVITTEFVGALSSLEPYGNKNEEPVFLSRGVMVRDFLRIGKDKVHGKYQLAAPFRCEAVGWNMADAMERHANNGPIDLVYRLSLNEYNGRVTSQLVLIDLRESGSSNEKINI